MHAACDTKPGLACPSLYSPGATPLFIASQMGHLDVAQCLLDAGANPDISKEHAVSPLYIAAECGSEDLLTCISTPLYNS